MVIRDCVGARTCSVAKLFLIGCLTLATVKAESLFLGFNTLTPVQVYSTDGTYIQDFGPDGSIAAGPGGSGNFFIVAPNNSFTTSAIGIYTGAQAEIGSFAIDDLIVDGAPGPNGTSWLSSYSGTVYQVSDTGTILTSWNTGYTHVGVASDGTYVYTTEGDGGNNIEKWSSTGTLAGTIASPFEGLYGLGYDSSTGDFWAGSTDYVYELNSAGSLLSTLDLPGDARTPQGAVHDGLEVGSLTPNISVPEPASVRLLGGVFAFWILIRIRRAKLKRIALLSTSFLATIGVALGSVTIEFTPSVSGSAPVGTTIVWTATATDSSSAGATFTYQFSVGPSLSQLQVRRDFSNFNSFPWTPTSAEGSYVVQVIANSSSGSSATAIQYYTITSRVAGSSPVVSATSHPLVALYSIPPCPAGRTARARFKGPGDSVWQATPFITCTGTTSLNVYIAGMRPSTTYTLQQDVYNGPFDTLGPLLSFTTGSIPSNIQLENYTVTTPATAPNSTGYPVVLTTTFGVPFATDTQGRLIWYLPAYATSTGYLVRPVAGGTFLGFVDDPSGVTSNKRFIREWDLAGNFVRETNADILSSQLIAAGTDPVTYFSHDLERFPNGDTAVIANVEKVADQGQGNVDVFGDMAIVLDSNLQVKFSWDPFAPNHLNVMRPAVLQETCSGTTGANGCPPVYNPNYTAANDWTHGNSLVLAPDGNLLFSLRHQDWVLKINYQNGSGDGGILWRLGNGGDFSVNAPASESYPWFSHQHDAEYAFNSSNLLTLYDNGNTRLSVQGSGNSRGQSWMLDETHKVATLVENQDLGFYSAAVGSAQLLSNGNYQFYSGYINSSTASSEEYTPGANGTIQFEQNGPTIGYRSFRMVSLYSEN